MEAKHETTEEKLTRISQNNKWLNNISKEDIEFLSKLSQDFTKILQKSTTNNTLNDFIFLLYWKTIFTIEWLEAQLTNDMLNYIISTSDLSKTLQQGKTNTNSRQEIVWKKDKLKTIFTNSFEKINESLLAIGPDYGQLFSLLTEWMSDTSKDKRKNFYNIVQHVNNDILQIKNISTKFYFCIATILSADWDILEDEKDFLSFYKEKLDKKNTETLPKDKCIKDLAYSDEEIEKVFEEMSTIEKKKLLWVFFLAAASDGHLHPKEMKYIYMLIKSLNLNEVSLAPALVGLQKVAILSAELNKANRTTTAAIEYAKYIQDGILPSEKHRKNIVPNFVMYKPKDIVGGDFYFFENYGKNDRYKIIVAADSTGHWVPGWFISMLGIAFLHQICGELDVKGELNPANILNMLRDKIKTSLEWSKVENDGMDMTLCLIDTKENTLSYWWAYNPLILIRNKELTTFKVNRQPVGWHIAEGPFLAFISIKLKNKDKFFIYSDGYLDQPKWEWEWEETFRKLNQKRFKEILLASSKGSLENQVIILEQKFNKWKGEREQIDDVLVIGFEPFTEKKATN